jgi:hypothetical protein
MTVVVYVNANKQVGDPDHLKVFANPDARKQEALGGRGQPAVDRDHRAAGVGRQRRGEERDGGADLLHACRTRPGQQRSRIKLLVALDAGGRLEPLGRDGAGVHRDHANIVPVARAAERLAHDDDGRIARRDADRRRAFDDRADAGDVDDRPAAAPGHQRVKGAAHVDVAEHLQVPRRAPACFVVEQRPAGNRASVSPRCRCRGNAHPAAPQHLAATGPD